MTNKSAGRALGLTAAFAAILALVITMSPVAANHLNVKTSDIANGAVTTPKLKDKAVGSAKIKKGSVRRGKIAKGAINDKRLSQDLRPLWAVVWGGPTINKGRGAVSVAEEGGVSSLFRLTFNRSVASCSYVVSPSAPDSDDPEQVGMISVSAATDDPKAVLVSTRDHTGAPDPLGFTVQVMC